MRYVMLIVFSSFPHVYTKCVCSCIPFRIQWQHGTTTVKQPVKQPSTTSEPGTTWKQRPKNNDFWGFYPRLLTWSGKREWGGKMILLADTSTWKHAPFFVYTILFFQNLFKIRLKKTYLEKQSTSYASMHNNFSNSWKVGKF